MAPRQIPVRASEESAALPLRTRRALRKALLVSIAPLLLSLSLAAQEPDNPAASAQDQSPSATNLESTFATVHGHVYSATGEPLPRALVSIEGDAVSGALTDGQGRFEIQNVPTGPQIFQIRKPGFFDHASSLPAEFSDDPSNLSHNILVVAGMEDLSFTMAPYCGARGQIELSSGDPAEGIAIELLRRSVEDGRGTWQSAGITRTNRDGAYHFGNLLDGVYLLRTQPAYDSEPVATLVAPGSIGAVERSGYPSLFYPDARDMAGATRIHLTGGQQAQANFTLSLEAFHSVAAVGALPRSAGAQQQGGAQFTASVLSPRANPLPYPVQFDAQTGSLQTALPDGNYTLFVTGGPNVQRQFIRQPDGSLDPATVPTVFTGAVDIEVAGHAIAGLRVPLAQVVPGTVNLSISHAGAPSSQASDQRGAISILAIPAGEAIGKFSFFSVEMAPGPNATMPLQPGPYWFRSDAGGQNLCEQSFTAGGANLAREPLVVGTSGTVPPMELVLRSDCARLTLSLPSSPLGFLPGEEPSYSILVVPDFDSTQLVQVQTMRPSSGSITVEHLTPGSYHVYTFDGTVRLEYRNPAVMAPLSNPGQQVTLSEGGTANLVLEVAKK